MNLEYFIAKRIYFGDKERKRISRPAIKIATIGVAIGIAVMIMTVCVILGFKASVNDKISGLAGDIQIQSFTGVQYGVNTGMEVTDTLMAMIKKETSAQISPMTCAKYCTVQGILKTDSDFLGIAFKGIGADYDTIFLHRNLVAGAIPRFGEQNAATQILISQSMADILHLKCSDRIYAYFIDSNGVRARKLTVSGIYQTNMSQYDNTLAFIDIHTARKLNNFTETQCSGIEIRYVSGQKHEDKTETIASAIRERTGNLTFRSAKNDTDSYFVRTVYDLYPGFFAWLELLDINVWIILVLMTCISAFTMTSGLLIIILEQTRMIGTLKSLGQRNASIRKIFLWFASFIILKGVIIGDLVGIGVCLLQQHTHFIHLDATEYYVNAVPVAINWFVILLLNVAIILFIILIEIIPSFLISHILPSQSMKYE